MRHPENHPDPRHPGKRPRRRSTAPLTVPLAALVALLVLGGGAAEAAVPSLDVLVPRKAPPDFQIAEMVLTVQIDQDAPVEFTVTSPAGTIETLGPFSPGDGPDSQIFDFVDSVSVEAPSAGLDADDPRRRTYTLTFSPSSDFDTDTCLTDMAADETWVVAVSAGLLIDHACLVSFDENTTADPVCDGFLRLVPNGEEFAEIGGLEAAEQTCRFGVEAMLVLDRSGSMSLDAGNGDSRIATLRDAVDTFLATLEAVRATEIANFGVAPADQVGVVLFNSNASDLPGIGAGLNPFSPAFATDVNDELALIAASGSTSIGDGLIEAAGDLGGAAGDRRRVIVLMSDGDQNTDMRVSSNVAERSVFTHAGATACPLGAASPGCTELPNLDNFDVCSVTAGTVSAAFEQVNQDVALASGCFYLNTLDFADLPTFFTNVLQNFLETTSWQTVLEGTGSAGLTTPFTTSVPITSTSAALTVGVVPQPRRFACLRVTPPGGPAFDPVCGSEPLLFSHSAARHAPRDLGGDWEIEVSDPETAGQGPTGFHLVVLADDLGVHASVGVDAASYAPGEPVLVEATLRDGAEPLVGLGPGGLEVRLATPGQTLGELMAAADPDPAPPTADDSLDAANAAIHNALAADPDALDRVASSVALRDDGAGGDRTAGDGVYSARLAFEEYGSHDLVVLLTGGSRGGDFRRQIAQTVFIKAVPDPGATEVATRVDPGGDLSTLTLRVTPRTRFGHPIGPGWGNYLWVRGPGVAPFKLSDDLDGSYSGSLSFSGDPPDLSLHFIPDSVIVGDDVPPELLPSPLDDTTVLVADLGTARSRWSWSLHGGRNYPEKPLSRQADGGKSLGVDLAYALTGDLELEVYLGWDEFDGERSRDDVDVLHLDLSLRWYLGGAAVRPFVLGGAGIYDVDPGSTDLGLLVGAGLQVPLSPTFAVEAEARYHQVDVTPDREWFAVHGVLRFGF